MEGLFSCYEFSFPQPANVEVWHAKWVLAILLYYFVILG